MSSTILTRSKLAHLASTTRRSVPTDAKTPPRPLDVYVRSITQWGRTYR